jgi:Glycosyl transferase family 11
MIAYRPGYYGYLGNQLFQYAATKALSLARNTDCLFPRNAPDLHKIFRLDAVAEEKQYLIVGQDGHPMLYQEPHFHFAPEFWDLPDWTILSGYFQSEKYFAPYAEQIKQEFTFRDPVGWPRFKDWVSVHVRRGDYLTFPHHHPPCTVDYYRKAMAEFPGAHFIVFSDDIEWCKLYLRGPDVEFSEGFSPDRDLQRMIACDHHIIANSSYSWWGAYLGQNLKKRVIAPRKWFGPAKASWSTVDLLPESWETL